MIPLRVFVYFNLHRKCWSIKALEGAARGRVVAHATSVRLDCVEFRVSEAGRQRVIREQRKNVHAGAVGVLASFGGMWTDAALAFDASGLVSPAEAYTGSVPPEGATRITYSPYRGPSFFNDGLGGVMPIRRASRVWLIGREVHGVGLDCATPA